MKKNKWNRIKEILSNSGYTTDQVQLLEDRIYDEICKMDNYSMRLYVFHVILVFTSLISTILISVFISMEKILGSNSTAGIVLFWLSISLSVVIHIVHEILFVFNISKKLVLYSSLKEKFKTELWKFASGVDKYKNLEPHEAYIHLCTKFEKLKSKFDQANIEIIAGNNNNKNSQQSSTHYQLNKTIPNINNESIRRWSRTDIEPISKYGRSVTP